MENPPKKLVLTETILIAGIVPTILEGIGKEATH